MSIICLWLDCNSPSLDEDTGLCRDHIMVEHKAFERAKTTFKEFAEISMLTINDPSNRIWATATHVLSVVLETDVSEKLYNEVKSKLKSDMGIKKC